MVARAVTSSVESSPIERAFTVLQAVVAAQEPVGIRELGRRTDLPRSTVHRLVGQLEELFMVARTIEGLVLPGSALATLTSGGPQPLLRDRLRPLLLALADRHGESTALAVDDGDAVLYVSQIDAASAVRAPDVEAERHPFHVVAHGLAMMAYWPDERLDSYLDRPLPASTSSSVVDPDAIRHRLEKIRAQGFAWTIEEFNVEVNGLATMVFDRSQPVAAIGLYGPSYRLSPVVRPDLAVELTATVSRLVATLL